MANFIIYSLHPFLLVNQWGKNHPWFFSLITTMFALLVLMYIDWVIKKSRKKRKKASLYAEDISVLNTLKLRYEAFFNKQIRSIIFHKNGGIQINWHSGSVDGYLRETGFTNYSAEFIEKLVKFKANQKSILTDLSMPEFFGANRLMLKVTEQIEPKHAKKSKETKQSMLLDGDNIAKPTLETNIPPTNKE